MNPTNNITCAPGTTTCEMYSRDCFPCPYNRYGTDCALYWKDIDPLHYLIAHILYAFVGFVLCVKYAQRLWSQRVLLRSAAEWRGTDKIWLCNALSCLLTTMEFIAKPLGVPYILTDLMNISITLFLVQGTIFIVVEWVDVMKFKGGITTKSNRLLRLQHIGSIFLWSVSIFATVMEVGSVCFKSNQQHPVLRRNCTFLEFTGAHNTIWNAIKNLNHAVITTLVAGVASFAGKRILKTLKYSTNTKTKKTLRKFMNYLNMVYFGVFISMS